MSDLWKKLSSMWDNDPVTFSKYGHKKNLLTQLDGRYSKIIII